jgi:hypothetical protein
MFGFFQFRKGERPGSSKSNSQRSAAYKASAIQAKKISGKWLSKAEYEKKTGRPGRAD